MQPDGQQMPSDPRNALAEERTKLAAERTFLAWLRTGMTSVGIGLALARFIIFRQGLHQELGHWIGQILILWGACIFIFSLINYRRGMKRFQRGVSDPSFIAMLIFTTILVIVSLILLGIIVE